MMLAILMLTLRMVFADGVGSCDADDVTNIITAVLLLAQPGPLPSSGP